MLSRMKEIAKSLSSLSSRTGQALGAKVASGLEGPIASAPGLLQRSFRPFVFVGLLGLGGYLLYSHSPMHTIERGEVGIRVNQFTGNVKELHEGSVIIVPGLYRLQHYSLRDQVYHPEQSAKADGPAPFQSVEGLSLGVDLSIRYALDPTKIASMSRQLPEDIGAEIVQPEVQGVIYKTFTRFTVREIFSTKRAEIQSAIETELRQKLAANGVILRSVLIGQIDLPAEYRAGLENLLAAELESEKMRFTLELKEKQVKQTEFESAAESVRREKAAEAAANEQIIAARAQAEAMKHVLPFKEKQIQQRQLEADAEKITRIKGAEAAAEARRIESSGEADSRHKLAEADAYRVEVMGKASSAQLARESALIAKNPLLIQKTLADKLSDKISVIIAPPPADGGFIGSTLLGRAAKPVKATVEDSEEGAE